MRAKFRCSVLQENFCDKWDPEKRQYVEPRVKEKMSEVISFHAVYSSNEGDPNRVWAKATPSGSLMMTIDNPAAWGHFKVNEEYFLDFFHSPKAQPAPDPAAP